MLCVWYTYTIDNVWCYTGVCCLHMSALSVSSPEPPEPDVLCLPPSLSLDYSETGSLTEAEAHNFP